MSRTVVHFTDASIFGGAEQMILTLLAGLDHGHWSPILLHHDEAGLAELIDGSRRLNVRTVEVPRHQTRRAIGSFLRQVRPTIFHAHLNWPLACSDGLVAAALSWVPGVVATQQLFVRIQSRRRILRHRLLSLAVDRYIAVSHHMATLLREVCVFGARKVLVVHNGIPLPPFERKSRIDLRRSLAGGEDRPIVLTLARLAPQKGIGFLIEAAARVPEALFAVAGDGPERAALEAKADVFGVRDRVLFLGHRRDTPDLLASCDLFVLPSLYEGLPVSVLEAMASAKPVVATAVGGTDEAVEDAVTGLLVPPSDPGALAEAIRKVIADRPLAERLGAEGLRRVRREFSAESVAARTAEIYQALATGREARAN
jgi:glycosyltransferase involved in cell wall biosynthesis